MTHSIGIDVGGTSIKAGIVDDNGKIIHQESSPTGEDSAENILSVILSLIRSLGNDSGLKHLPVGIGVPGIVTPQGDIISFANIHSLEKYPLRDSVSQALGVKVWIDNDANCAAAGELLFGAAMKMNHCILVTLGTGIGLGIIINGRIYHGSRGAAGEAGHMIIVPGGRKCGCGKHGCWETYGSAKALTDTAIEQSRLNSGSVLSAIPAKDMNAKIIEDAARKGDYLAIDLFEKTAEYIGIGIANLLNIFDPDIVLVGGGLSHADDFLLDKVRRTAGALANPIAAKTPVKKAILGNNAGIIGSASLPIINITD